MQTYLLIGIIVVLIIVLVVVLMSSRQNAAEVRSLADGMKGLTDKNYEQQIQLMQTLNENTEKQSRAIALSISQLQESNEKKLDEMRSTVDEKLSDTLNKRLGASFATVSTQLERVYKSLGDMQRMSGDVTSSVQGLSRVLTNVKSRGTWAEVQLKNILDETIPAMYETNVRTNAAYNGQVEFAVKIPNAEDSDTTWLPIDSKFPLEDYARLSAAAEAGDVAALEAARKALEAQIKSEARDISKYIDVPNTTPFAIMYLATEGLYAEVMSSKNGLAEQLQAKGIMIAGPSTVTALLNSLAIGFKSVAINKKASEVFDILGAAKAQYNKFGEQLALIRKRLESASQALDDADKRNEIIIKRLKSIETLDSDNSASVLGLDG